MKNAIFLLFTFLTFVSNKIRAQKTQDSLDSICYSILQSNNSKYQPLFEKLIGKRKESDLANRIDSSDADYIFIVETINSHKYRTTLEEYYFHKEDTIPKQYYSDNKFYHPKTVYRNQEQLNYFHLTRYWETLNPLLQKFDTLKHFQTLVYNPTIIINSGCVINKKYEKETAKRDISNRKKTLRKTCQIMTLIDKVSKRTIVSLQIPPKSFHFKTTRYLGVWDF